MHAVALGTVTNIRDWNGQACLHLTVHMGCGTYAAYTAWWLKTSACSWLCFCHHLTPLSTDCALQIPVLARFCSQWLHLRTSAFPSTLLPLSQHPWVLRQELCKRPPSSSPVHIDLHCSYMDFYHKCKSYYIVSVYYILFFHFIVAHVCHMLVSLKIDAAQFHFSLNRVCIILKF